MPGISGEVSGHPLIGIAVGLLAMVGPLVLLRTRHFEKTVRSWASFNHVSERTSRVVSVVTLAMIALGGGLIFVAEIVLLLQ